VDDGQVGVGQYAEVMLYAGDDATGPSVHAGDVHATEIEAPDRQTVQDHRRLMADGN